MRLEVASGDDFILIQCPSSNYGQAELMVLGCIQVDLDVSRDGDNMLLCSVILRIPQSQGNQSQGTAE